MYHLTLKEQWQDPKGYGRGKLNRIYTALGTMSCCNDIDIDLLALHYPTPG